MLASQRTVSKLRISSYVRTVTTVKNFINGKFEESTTNKWIDVINPATQEVISRVPQSTPEELNRAVANSAAAFKTWKEVPVQQRQVAEMPLSLSYSIIFSL